MDENNSFLSNYNKGQDKPEKTVADKPEKKVSIKQADLGYKYEQKSGFKKPAASASGQTADKNRKRLIIPIVVISVLVVAAVIVLLSLLGRGIEMIDFEGRPLSDVQIWASENGILLQITEVYDDVYEEGAVIEQDIPPGDSIKKGGVLGLIVSLGHDLSVRLPLPDLMTMTMAEIEAWAEENYMTKVRFTTEYSDTVPSGNVIRYEINDSTVVDDVRRDTPVYIVVSKGSEDETQVDIEVPDFKTMTLSEAYLWADENGITLNVEEQYDDYVSEGAVITQSVKAAEKIVRGDEITLTISKGKLITVPDFSGYSKEKATAVASSLGISVTVSERYSSGSVGAFLWQSISAGSVYEQGDVLELRYSLGNKIVLSSFVGQTRDAIEAWAKELNELGAGITIKTSYTQSNEPRDTIIFQDKTNTVIAPKTTINVTVSRGKAVFVPDFVAAEGVSYDEAILREKALSMCEELGLVPVFVEESKEGRLPGEIWYQSISAGTEVTEGTEITLKYTPANVTVTVPNFDGKTRADIEAGGYNYSFVIIFVEDEEFIAGYEGRVYDQSLTAGSTAASGSEITLYIGAEGTAPDISATPAPT